MKNISTHLALAGLLLLGGGLSAQAQTPITVFTDDFETTGATGPGSFTAVNGQEYNYWTTGTAAGNGPTQAGTKAAYITSTSSPGTYTYYPYYSSVAHLYRDVELPAGYNTFEVSFDWKNLGEVNDYLAVYALPVSYPVQDRFEPAFLRGGSRLTPVGGGLQGKATYSRVTYAIPNSPVLAGTPIRLVFTWVNNATAGSPPPAALDNVTLTARNAYVGLAGTYTIDNTLPASSTNFPSFTAAVNRLNQALPSAPVTFNVPAGRVFSEQVPELVVGGTPTAPVVFRKLGSGANPVVTSAASTVGAILDVAGADYLTFDGIDVRSGTTTGPWYGYRIRNLTPTNGARRVTIKNATISMNRTNISTVAVVQASNDNSGSVGAADTTGCNARIHYQNLLIQNSYGGMSVQGYLASLPEYDVEIDQVTFGSGAGDIGNGSTGVVGANFVNVKRLRFHDNLIQGLRNTNGVIYGLWLNNLFGSGPDASSVYNNQIRDLRQINPNVSTVGTSVYGIYFTMGTSATGSQEINIVNNEISGLSRGYPTSTLGTPNFLVQGIYVYYLNQASRLLLANNTVVVDNNNSLSASSVAMNVGDYGQAQGVYTLRNNLLVNLTSAQTATSARHVALYATNRQLGGIGSSTDYNNYFVPNAAGGLVVGSATATFATLAQWQAASLQDQHTHDLDPQFAPDSFLPASPALDNQGTPLAAVTTDLTGKARPAARPDVGAYEFLTTVTATTSAAQAALGLRAWPNPTRGALTVAAAAGVSGQLEVLDVLGRRVLPPGQLAAGGLATLPGLDALSGGVYLLRLTRPDGQHQTLRLLRQ